MGRRVACREYAAFGRAHPGGPTMTAGTVILLAAGLVVLVVGAEVFVRGASRVAVLMGISPLVIGLTIAAFGTSTPELAVTLQSALTGSADLALGNVVGSNICNILLILGISALATPLVVHAQLVRIDVPVMVGVSLLTLGLALDGVISRFDGILLVLLAVGYTVFLFRQSRISGTTDHAVTEEFDVAEPDEEPGLSASLPFNLLLIPVGIGLLVVGGRWLVSGAVTIAQTFGVSELVIGLTVVAVGTSLPELATSLIAILRGERDLAVGNIVGSNIFNLLFVLGLAGAVAPGGIPIAPAALRFDLPVMIAVAVACLPIFFSGHRIARWEGLLFLSYYVAYTVYLVLASASHAALPAYSSVMAGFVLPLTALTLMVVGVRAWRRQRPSAPV